MHPDGTRVSEMANNVISKTKEMMLVMEKKLPSLTAPQTTSVQQRVVTGLTLLIYGYFITMDCLTYAHMQVSNYFSLLYMRKCTGVYVWLAKYGLY